MGISTPRRISALVDMDKLDGSRELTWVEWCTAGCRTIKDWTTVFDEHSREASHSDDITNTDGDRHSNAIVVSNDWKQKLGSLRQFQKVMLRCKQKQQLTVGVSFPVIWSIGWRRWKRNRELICEQQEVMGLLRSYRIRNFVTAWVNAWMRPLSRFGFSTRSAEFSLFNCTKSALIVDCLWLCWAQLLWVYCVLSSEEARDSSLRWRNQRIAGRRMETIVKKPRKNERLDLKAHRKPERWVKTRDFWW